MNQRKSEPLTHCRIKYIMHGVACVYSNIKQQQSNSRTVYNGGQNS